MAAIGEAEAIPVLERFLSDPSIPVKETCQLALRSLREKTMSENVTAKSKFNTIDPIAQSEVSVASLSLEQLGDCLLDTSRELYERYEALFVLRDLQTPEAYSYITKAMYDTSSALFRHEVLLLLCAKVVLITRVSLFYLGGFCFGSNSNSRICRGFGVLFKKR